MKKIILFVLFILQFEPFALAESKETKSPSPQKIDSTNICDAYRTKQLLLNLLLDDYTFTLNYRYPSDIILTDAKLTKIDQVTQVFQCKISIFRDADPSIGKKLIKDEIIFDVQKTKDNRITIVLPGIIK